MIEIPLGVVPNRAAIFLSNSAILFQDRLRDEFAASDAEATRLPVDAFYGAWIKLRERAAPVP